MLVLKSIDDPRDALAKARRSELVRFARANGVSEIDPNMPADLMRAMLRQKGLTRIDIPQRTLGLPNQPHGNAKPEQANAQVHEPKGIELNALTDLARQWQQQQATAPQPSKQLGEMGINELRAEGKRLGIKFERRDNMVSMKAKIEAASV